MAAASGLAAMAAWPAHAVEGDAEILVERARVALLEIKNNKDVLQTVSLYVQNAYGVLVVPDQIKLGFILGGSHGRGLLLTRDTTTGAWSEPAIYDLYGGSVGLQIGGQSSDVIYTIMNKGALDKLLSSTSFKMGADASAAIGPAGAGVGAGTTPNFGEDIYLFAINQGLFGGLSIDGTVTVPMPAWNKSLYGRDVTVQEIMQGAVVNPISEPLKQVLNEF
ncbi:MAG TPA: lipid-binding SYLF domain-containing protein [Geminicoccus sp.]|jgi:lipid-binding SYLF domain-containing protein|uniref:lipid-binding SYLF domain-containing protein n=1 Tax=Geminicoccus sp. TaxID=2024832 RepID=UPI002E34A42E|nr:lipid-binding SYLF domain-containing protein [Geminicoccus sp.]HEX2526955.1 lipid-binding SYLF domain-containing protein [Geminicoccus sp.]